MNPASQRTAPDIKQVMFGFKAVLNQELKLKPPDLFPHSSYVFPMAQFLDPLFSFGSPLLAPVQCATCFSDEVGDHSSLHLAPAFLILSSQGSFTMILCSSTKILFNPTTQRVCLPPRPSIIQN